MFQLKIVDFVCDSNDRFFKTAKIIKIFEKCSCRDVLEVWAFINVCVYYRIWVINFIIIAFFIYSFLKNKKFFVWAEEQKNVMNTLKLILTTASILKSLNYSFLIDEIILTINFSLKKWNAFLSQINSEKNKNDSSRYESNLWMIFKSRYNVKKRECRKLLKTLKKSSFLIIQNAIYYWNRR